MITKDTIIGDVIKENENAVGILMSFGMGCVGCPSSQMETIEQACSIHGLDSVSYTHLTLPTIRLV